MPRSLPIYPAEVRASGVVEAPDIPLNAYQPDLDSERKRWGDEAIVRAFRHMCLIREFENLLEGLKHHGQYEGIVYDHQGPAHLSVGQEAVAVGQAMALSVDDLVFGSHRSHGELLAKCFAAIAELDASELDRRLAAHRGGAVAEAVQRFSPETGSEFGIDVVIYGLLAEIFARDTGFNRGLGGSMHAFFTPLGAMPNNAIVGGSGPIAVGAALFRRINGHAGICVANLGDASLGTGPVWESMVLSSMDQYLTLWDDGRGRPPVLFNISNNFYGMGGQTAGETMGLGDLVRMALGVNPEAMHAERIDGYNPLAVADATARKRELLIAGGGPVLLDVVAYRLSGHSSSDASSYRDRGEVQAWESVDCLLGYRRHLVEGGVASERALDEVEGEAAERVRSAARAAIDFDISPRIDARSTLIEDVMFSRQPTDARAAGDADVLLPISETRFAKTAQKHRSGLNEDGATVSPLRAVTYAEALFEAMIHRFYEDPTMVAYGEENRDWGGAFGVYRGLTEALPYRRLFNSSISEAAIVGSGVGYALAGGRAVVELMYCDFLGRAGDEVFNQMAKWQAMSAGELMLPLVLRVSVGARYGAQHSQDWSSLTAHIPGLQVMFPATPYDAKGMLNLALRGSDPVVFFESQRLYNTTETLVEGGVPTGYYEVPLGQPVVRRDGTDITIATLGATLYRALDAAEQLEQHHGLAAEVIDLRFLNPLDYQPVLDSVKKTGRLLVASDACERGSFAHTVASVVSSAAFDFLDAPVAVVGARNWITPAAELESMFFPQAEWIIDSIHEQILPLEGHLPSTAAASDELLRRHRNGV